MNDNEIIDLFFKRSEQAISELSQKYNSKCMSVSFGILGNYQDAEECVNDAYLGTWKAIPPNRPNPLLTFVLKIVRNISLKKLNYNSAQKRNKHYSVHFDELDESLSDDTLIEECLEIKESAKLVESFIRTLSRENRLIFIRRYWFFDTYEAIAYQTQLSEGAIRTRLSRLRKKMNDYLNEKGFNI